MEFGFGLLTIHLPLYSLQNNKVINGKFGAFIQEIFIIT